MRLPEQFWMAIVFLGFLAIAYLIVNNQDELNYVQQFAVMAPLAGAVLALVTIYLVWKLFEHFRKQSVGIRDALRKLYK
jgi:predicted lysophospholipase L1 biosynthesis ABC-type transport system permease subunit